MDDIFSFNQIFTSQRKDDVYRAVPEAPAFDIFTDLFQDPPSTNFTWNAESSEYESKDSVKERKSKMHTTSAVTERGDNGQEEEDTIYLGSQFPMVHKVRASQVARIQKDRNVEVLAVDPAASHDTCSRQQTQASVEMYNPAMNKMFKKRTNDPLQPIQNKQEETIKAPATIILPFKNKSGFKLRSVQEIPELYRKIFSFPYFNIVQSKVFDDVMYTDGSLVLCAPTGSGKTAVFEMAILRLLQQSQTRDGHLAKVVYMAPIKALCSEKYTEWKAKFEPFSLRVMELTGDTETEDFFELQQVNIILTTPEKWDSMTRRWRDNKGVMEAICLFLIDEIHVLNDSTRGATVEAVLSRMKTIQAARSRSVAKDTSSPGLRFIAVSATITNIEDLAEWLGNNKTNPALYYKFDESVRPVRLRKVVLGYYFAEHKQSDFQFDINLSYKLTGIIHTYSENKPTLVFCATRKSAIQGAEILGRDGKHTYIRNSQHRQALQAFSFHIKDTKLRDLVAQGIGYHHAGMDLQDRKSMEQIFANGELPVLVTTSTLAMGVNLPAHLVIIKSTMYYNMGVHQEYSDTQVLQMIGRAGRPQFDTSATAVIMTKNQTKMKYENLVNGTQLLESSLHKNLIEHLNAEITLHTITDMSVALEWLKYTFLYIRVMKNPQHYGMKLGMSKSMIEKRLQELCMQSLNQLHGLNLINMDQETMDVKPTENGRLMARYCISYKTAELFHSIGESETVQDLLTVISKCEEFEDIKLRTNEKRALNTLNRDKNRNTIRHQITGKIKTTDQKVNCLIQAQFGCLLVQDFALQQDTSRIFRAGMRITRCLVEFLSQKKQYKSLLSALQLCKCFKVKLWEDSKYVSRQLDGIGPALSTAMVNAGLTTFEKIEQTNPREIELIANRHPPFGNQVRSSIAKLPKYEIVIEQVSKYSMQKAEIVITIQLTNREELQQNQTITNTAGATGTYTNHTCTLLVGDEDNAIVCKQRIMDKQLLRESSWYRRLDIKRAEKGPELHIHYVSQDIVGLDVDCTYTPNYLGRKRISSTSTTPKVDVPRLPPQSDLRQPCNHTCRNKALCAHDCCKTGVTSKRKQTTCKTMQTTAQTNATRRVSSHLDKLKDMSTLVPNTPSLAKRVRIDTTGTPLIDLTRFAYTSNKRQNDMVEQEDLDCAIMDDMNKNTNMAFSHQSSMQAESAYGNTPYMSAQIDGPSMPGFQDGIHRGQCAGQVEQSKYWTNDDNNWEDVSYMLEQDGLMSDGYVKEQPVRMKRGMKQQCRTKSMVNKPNKDRHQNRQQNKMDWAELDMYQICREVANTAGEGQGEEVDSLPDIDDEGLLSADHNMENDPQNLGAGDIVQETDYGFTYVHGDDRDIMPADWDDKLTSQINNEPLNTRYGPTKEKFGSKSFQQKSSKQVRGNFARPSKQQTNTKTPTPPHQYINRDREDQLNEDDSLYKIEDFSTSDEELNPEDMQYMNANKTGNKIKDNMRGPALKNHFPSKQYGFKKGAHYQKMESNVQFADNPLKDKVTHYRKGRKLDNSRSLYQKDDSLYGEDEDNILYDYSTGKGVSIYENKGDLQQNNTDIQLPHCDNQNDSFDNDIQYGLFAGHSKKVVSAIGNHWQLQPFCNKLMVYCDGNNHENLQSKNRNNSNNHQFKYRNNCGNIQSIEQVEAHQFDMTKNEDSKWENYCNSQESTASNCLNWQFPTRSGTEVVMDRRGQGQRSHDQQIRSQSQGPKVQGSLDSHQIPGRGNGLAMNHGITMTTECQDMTTNARKYGQVLAWVSDSENHEEKSPSSQEWESCGSDEAKLADLAEVPPSYNTDQQGCDSASEVYAAPQDQNHHRPIDCEQQINPVSFYNDKPFTAELINKNKNDAAQKPSKSTNSIQSNTINAKTSSAAKDGVCLSLNRPQVNPSSYQKSPQLKSVVTKKPQFSSFFTREQEDRKAQNFNNIFEGIF